MEKTEMDDLSQNVTHAVRLAEPVQREKKPSYPLRGFLLV
jgi:hypothetical protein